MKSFPMHRRIKNAITYLWIRGRYAKSDRLRGFTKCRKKAMRNFIKKEGLEEINEYLNKLT